MKLYSAEQAIDLVKEGDCVVVNGFMLASVAEELLMTLGSKYAKGQEPKNLTLICGGGVGDLGDGKDSGLNFFAHEGMIKRVIVGHYGSNDRIVKLTNENKIEAYNWPQGVINHVIRAIGNGDKGYMTKIGLKTYMDPRLEGSKMNRLTTEDLVELVNFKGEEYLYYNAPKIDIALIRGTSADTNGNITFEDEIAYSMARHAAMAAKACGGKVIVQVKNYVNDGQLDAQQVQIAGVFVDAIVLTTDLEKNHRMTPGTLYNVALAGHKKIPLHSIKPLEMSERKIIGRRAAMELVPNAIINLGIGVPEAVSAVAAEEGCGEQLVMTVEAGSIGGIAAGGKDFGASLNAWCMVDEPTQFDFYHSGGLDLTFLGLAEVNAKGDVNVSKFGSRIKGCGGFIDISQSTKNIVYCGAFTAGGLKTEITNGILTIVQEGRSKKFKKEIGQITFSGDYANETAQNVLYVTERAVFKLMNEGLTLIEIAPGIDLKRDIIDQMEFEPIISEELIEMNGDIFNEDLFGLYEIINNK